MALSDWVGVKWARTIKRVDRSPLNERRWCLTLACGHETWITSRCRPRMKDVICVECKAKAKGDAS